MAVWNARRYGVGGAIATVAAVAAAGVAAYAFIDLRVSDVYILAGIAIALISITAAWPVSGPFFAARILAAVQGGVWFILLIHGGMGLMFGPLAWLAAIVVVRSPGVAAVLLLVPVVWLVQSWAPILQDTPSALNWVIVAALTVPGSIAASVFLHRIVRPRARIAQRDREGS